MDNLEYAQHEADVVKFAVRQIIPDKMMTYPDFIVRRDHILKGMVYELRAKFLCGKPFTEKFTTEQNYHEVPSSWWQYFKLRWLPKWLLNKFPPQYERLSNVTNTEIRIYNVCPHIELGNSQTHLRFITAEPEYNKEKLDEQDYLFPNSSCR